MEREKNLRIQLGFEPRTFRCTLELKICFLTMVSEIMEIAPIKLHDVIVQVMIIMSTMNECKQP